MNKPLDHHAQNTIQLLSVTVLFVQLRKSGFSQYLICHFQLLRKKHLVAKLLQFFIKYDDWNF